MRKPRISIRVFLVLCIVVVAIGGPLLRNVYIVWPEQRRRAALEKLRTELKKELAMALDEVRKEQRQEEERERQDNERNRRQAQSQYPDDQVLADAIFEVLQILRTVDRVETQWEKRVRELRDRLATLGTQ